MFCELTVTTQYNTLLTTPHGGFSVPFSILKRSDKFHKSNRPKLQIFELLGIVCPLYLEKNIGFLSQDKRLRRQQHLHNISLLGRARGGGVEYQIINMHLKSLSKDVNIVECHFLKAS